MRTGEAAARHWAGWEPDFLGRLGQLTATTSWSTAHRTEKLTKTRVAKWIPIHPDLAAVLEAWRATGWETFTGRKSEPTDLILPSIRGKHRGNSFSGRKVLDDLLAIGLPHQRHCESRSTFINLCEGAGADPTMVGRITHASIGQTKDLYRRVRLLWPQCAAVEAIKISRPRVVTGPAGDSGVSLGENGGVTGESRRFVPESQSKQGDNPGRWFP